MQGIAFWTLRNMRSAGAILSDYIGHTYARNWVLEPSEIWGLQMRSSLITYDFKNELMRGIGFITLRNMRSAGAIVPDKMWHGIPIKTQRTSCEESGCRTLRNVMSKGAIFFENMGSQTRTQRTDLKLSSEREPKGTQSKPKGQAIHQQTPDQPPARPLCYYIIRY